MKILVAHNFYKQPGGEDQCVAAEVAMLRAHGHEVTQYCLHNECVDAMGDIAAIEIVTNGVDRFGATPTGRQSLLLRIHHGTERARQVRLVQNLSGL